MNETDLTARGFADRYWDDLLSLEPVVATMAGDERFDDRLPDWTSEGRARRVQVQRNALDEIERIDRSAIGVAARTALDMVESIAHRELEFMRHRFERFWAVSHMFYGGYYFGPPQLLAQIGSAQRANTPERLERYVARLKAVPAYLAVYMNIMEEAVQAGQTAPLVVVERSIGLLERQVAAAEADSPAMEPVRDAPPEYRERVGSALGEVVMPAFEDYLDALKAYAPAARTTLGLGALPGGDEMYAAEIFGWTTLPLQAKELHELGREHLATVEEERGKIAAGLGHPDPTSAIAAHEATGRNRAESRGEILRLAEEQVARSWQELPRFFGRLPKANCEVRPVEEFREADVLDFYQPPDATGSRPGVFFVNTADRPLHSVATTTYHETNPGHHLQTALAQEMEDQPALTRFGGELQGQAFGEGWGLYSERLADEMGLYRDDYERLGMLELQAFRAARLVVDTGIHAFGWDRQAAIATLEQTGLPPNKAAIEVDRYIAMPGQALSYRVGQSVIEELRAAQAKQGEQFSLSDFHDRLLALGCLPLPALKREMEVSVG